MVFKRDISAAYKKLWWAERHYENLRSEIEPFEQNHAYTVRIQFDADTGEHVFHVNNLAEVGDDWGLKIGDAIHSARSALDYLAIRLVCIYEQADPGDVGGVYFPICSEAPRFQGSRASLEKRMLPGHLTRIEELQPFHDHDPSIWGSPKSPDRQPSLCATLDALSNLDNIDKHRLIHATWHRAEWEGGMPPLPPGYKVVRASRIAPIGEPLYEDAPLVSAAVEPPLPGWSPSPVEMKRCFPLTVGLPSYRGVWHPITETLRRLIKAVDAVLFIFDPVFSEHDPPLPVTVAADRFFAS
jgi:hypothetical protein